MHEFNRQKGGLRQHHTVSVSHNSKAKALTKKKKFTVYDMKSVKPSPIT